MSMSNEYKKFAAELMGREEKPGPLFKALFDFLKAGQSHFTLAYICRECQMSSRGYLSEFLNGKRSLGQRYWKSIIHAFKLQGRYAELALLIFALEQEKDDQAQQSMRARLEILRRSIRNDHGVLPKRLQGLFFAFDVFCAFGLFKDQPRKEDLTNYFGREFALEIDHALQALLALDLISIDRTGNRFRLSETSIRFNESEDGVSVYNYLRYAVRDAEANIKKWYRTEDGLFESSVISVRKSEYRAFRQRFFEEWLVSVRSLESCEADAVVRLNVQMYPVR